MAKKKQNEIEQLIVSIPILIFAITYGKSKSLIFAGIITALLFIVTIAFLLYKQHVRNQKYLSSGIDIVDKMSGKEFEEFLSAHFKKMGYSVKLTPASNDYGCDLIIKNNDTKTVVQAKRYKTKVGIKAVQEIIAAVNFYNANNSMVVTNNYYTNNAKALAKSSNVELWDRDKLIDVMSKADARVEAKKISDESPDTEKCPRCNSPLVLRNSRRGKFVGCSSFPKCRYTEDMSS